MTCPHCGYCPHCGRSGYHGAPFNPWLVPYSPPYPYPTWGGGAGITPNGGGGGTYTGPDFGNYQQGGPSGGYIVNANSGVN